jgi:hypothetical protein
MTREGFEPSIPVFEQAKAFHTLDRAATVIGRSVNYAYVCVYIYIYVYRVLC